MGRLENGLVSVPTSMSIMVIIHGAYGLSDHGKSMPVKWQTERARRLTKPAGERLFIVDIALHPRHQMFDVLGCRHFRGSLEVLGVLPEIFESRPTR